MNGFLEWLSRFVGQWKCWIVVPPWDVGVHVRLGKSAKSLPPGFHFRVPFVDVITLVNTRLRVITVPPVTLKNGGKNCRVMRSCACVKIVDPLKAMMDFSSVEAIVAARIQEILQDAPSQDECKARLVGLFDPAVIVVESVYYTEDAEARPIRLFNDGWAHGTNDTNEVVLVRY